MANFKFMNNHNLPLIRPRDATLTEFLQAMLAFEIMCAREKLLSFGPSIPF